MIELKDASKSFFFPEKIDILKELNLKLEPGNSYAITGPSGVGKSTLLSLLGSLEQPTSGHILINGTDLSKIDANTYRRDHVGLIFQSYNLLEDYTALENVLVPAMIARKKTSIGSDAYTRALMLIEKVGLQNRVNHLAKQLSGGEKQRVAIARALCNNPKLILADEPTGNLDEAHSKSIHSLLIDLTQEFHKTLVVVTHDLQLANLCNHKYLLKNGHLRLVN